LSSDDEIDDTVLNQLGNGESKAGLFISRRPSMTAELETRMRQVRLSEGSDPDRQSGPSSPSTTGKWGLFGMNWKTQNTILGDRNTTPPQELNQPPLSPLALFQPSPFNPPAPRQVSPSNATPGYAQSRTRFPRPNPLIRINGSNEVSRSPSAIIHSGIISLRRQIKMRRRQWAIAQRSLEPRCTLRSPRRLSHVTRLKRRQKSMIRR
jgi:hypothetical protein